MRLWWTLFKKEFRFLLWPGIGLIVLLFAIHNMTYLISELYPDFYHNNIRMHPQNSPPVAWYFVYPLMMVTTSNRLSYIYAILFLYTIIYEHLARTRQQIASLSIRQHTPLIAKATAVMTWYVIMIGTGPIMKRILVSLYPGAGIGGMSPRLLLFMRVNMIGETFLLISLIALAYGVSRAFRRLPVIAGTGAFIIGYVLRGFLAERLEPILDVFNSQTTHMVGSIPWVHMAIPFIIAPLFIVPALILSDRFSEV